MVPCLGSRGLAERTRSTAATYPERSRRLTVGRGPRGSGSRPKSINPAASFDRVVCRRSPAHVVSMDEAVFLIVLGVFAILYTAGWFVISFPKAGRR